MKLRAAILRAVWSRKQHLASSGAGLGLLDGPRGCDPSFCLFVLFGFGFGFFAGICHFGLRRCPGFLGLLILTMMVAMVMVLYMLWLLVLFVLVFIGILL